MSACRQAAPERVAVVREGTGATLGSRSKKPAPRERASARGTSAGAGSGAPSSHRGDSVIRLDGDADHWGVSGSERGARPERRRNPRNVRRTGGCWQPRGQKRPPRDSWMAASGRSSTAATARGAQRRVERQAQESGCDQPERHRDDDGVEPRHVVERVVKRRERELAGNEHEDGQERIEGRQPEGSPPPQLRSGGVERAHDRASREVREWQDDDRTTEQADGRSHLARQDVRRSRRMTGERFTPRPPGRAVSAR